MANVDIGQLQSLVDELNAKAKKFTDAAKNILDKAKSLDGAAQDLANNTDTWAGQGSKVFLTTWHSFHNDSLQSSLALTSTALVLTKLANKLNTSVENLTDLQNQAIAMGILTTGLLVLDISQFGLDPLTDTATAGTGGREVAIQAEIESEQEAIVSFDTQLSAEIDQITSQIQESEQLGQLTLNESTELIQLQENVIEEPQTQFFQRRNSRARCYICR